MEGESKADGDIDKETTGPEKVLIERDGKFELVNASDMQAVDTHGMDSNETNAEHQEAVERHTSAASKNPEPSVEAQGEGEPQNITGIEALQSPHEHPIAVTDPDRQPTAVPDPDRQPTAATDPDRQPTAVPDPDRQPTAATVSDRQPTAVPDPDRQPTAVPDPDRQPTVVPVPDQQPTAVTVPDRQLTVVPVPDQQPRAVPDPDQQPTVVTDPDQQPTVTVTSDTHTLTREDSAQKELPHSSCIQMPSAGSNVLKSTSRVQVVENIHHKETAFPKRTNKDLTSGSAISLKQVDKRDQISRARSAPGLRVAKAEEETEKRKRSEAAFAAWLLKKNKDLAEKQKLDKAKQKSNEGEVKQRRHQNEVAFQAWLAAKERELHEQRTKETLSRPTTSMPCDSSAAYENWLSRKKEQKRKEIEVQQKTLKETEEAAKKADPTIVEKAYKRWLHAKNKQAQEEAVRKEQYQRFYFSQSRQLKQSLTLRFEGF